eukprot:scaffold293641_cov30-Tisochrysis_lutea.AAC.2
MRPGRADVTRNKWLAGPHISAHGCPARVEWWVASYQRVGEALPTGRNRSIFLIHSAGIWSAEEGWWQHACAHRLLGRPHHSAHLRPGKLRELLSHMGRRRMLEARERRRERNGRGWRHEHFIPCTIDSTDV